MKLSALLLLLISLLTARAAPPANDDYAHAIDLTGTPLPLTLAGTCAEATVEPGEYTRTATYLVGGIHSTVWYRWTAPVSGWVGTTLPAGVAFTAYQDGTGVPDRSRAIRNIGVYYANPWLPVRITAGQVLTFQVGASLNAGAGPFTFTLNTVPPPNDGATWGGNADLPRAPSVSVTSTNIGATLAPGEVLPPGANVGSTVYFLLDAYGAFPCEISTAGSALDTVLAVYLFDQASLLAWNDDAAPGDLSSSVTFTPAASSQWYVIQVGGWSGQQGEFQLQVNYTLPPAPANDSRAAALDLGSTPQVSFPIATHAASSEPGEVLPGGLRRTLWYRWTAPASGAWKLEGSYTLGNESPSFTVCRTVPGLPAVEDVLTHGLPAIWRTAANESYLISVGGRLGYAGFEIASTISLTSAEPVVVETFGTTVSGALSSQGGATGGWGGPWAYDPGRNSFGDLFSPSQAATTLSALSALSVAGSMGDPGGRHVLMPAVNGTVSLRRPLATPVGLQVMYFSFLLRTESTAPGAYAGIRLRPSNGNTNTFIGKPAAGDAGKWVIEDLGGDNQQSFQSFPVVPGRAARLVVRTDFGSMKAYTDVAPDMPQFRYQHNAYTAAAQGVSSLGLYANAACSLDDVRVGPTWESVTEPAVEAPVIFNEACTRTQWDFNGDGVASETQDAYCELVNRSSVPQVISGQGVWYGTVLAHVFPPGTVLHPRQAIVVFGGGNVTEGVTGAFGNAWVQRATSGGIGAPLTLRSTAATSAAVLASFSESHAFTPATRWPELIGSAWYIWPHSDTRFVPGGNPGSPGQRVNLAPWLPLTQALTASISRGSVAEGAGWDAATITVSRPGPLTEPLTVQLRSSHPTLVYVSDTAVIPAGEAAVTAPLTIAQDFIATPDQVVTLTVIGSGFLNGTATVTVLDSDRHIFINEINAQSNGGGVDFNEFIELYDGGLGFKSLHDFIVVLFDADAGNDGAYRVIDLSGRQTSFTGFFVIDSNTFPELTPGWLTNGGGAVAIYKKRTGDGMGGGPAMPPCYDFPPGAPPVVNAQLVDAITHVTDDAPDLALVALFTPAGVQADEGPAPNPPVTFNVSTGRCPDARAPFDSGAFRQSMPTPGSSNLTYPGFNTWASTRGITGMTADEDFDGLDNLLEYALGGIPLSLTGDDANSIHLIPSPLDNPFNELRMFVRKGAEAGHDPRLRWDVEVSTDMIHWSTRDVDIVQEDCATLTAAFIGTTPRVQMRLRVMSVP